MNLCSKCNFFIDDGGTGIRTKAVPVELLERIEGFVKYNIDNFGDDLYLFAESRNILDELKMNTNTITSDKR